MATVQLRQKDNNAMVPRCRGVTSQHTHTMLEEYEGTIAREDGTSFIYHCRVCSPLKFCQKNIFWKKFFLKGMLFFPLLVWPPRIVYFFIFCKNYLTSEEMVRDEHVSNYFRRFNQKKFFDIFWKKNFFSKEMLFFPLISWFGLFWKKNFNFWEG